MRDGGDTNVRSKRTGMHLSARLEEANAYERRRALRALLQHPLLSADGDRTIEFGLVRRHAEWLREWFARHLDWRLQVDGETARLRKSPADLSDGTRPARDARNGAPFTRRRYVILCVALAALERSDRQTTLGHIAEETVAFTRADGVLIACGMGLDLQNFDHRRDLVQVIRLLLELHVLSRIDGDEQQYLHDKGDVLYRINRPALAAMLNVRRGPSTVDTEDFEQRLREIVDEQLPNTDDARNRRIRTRLMRRLIDDPVVYYEELAEEERAYLNSQRARMLRELELATDAVSEVRCEGIALVDDRGDLSDVGLPEEGTDGHLTLLVAEHLARHAREHSNDPISTATLYQHVARLIGQHRNHWRKAVQEPGAETALTEQTLDRLAALRLVRRIQDGVVPLPAIGRYALRDSDAMSTENFWGEAEL